MTDQNKVLLNEIKINMNIWSQINELDEPLNAEEEQEIGAQQKEDRIPESEHLEEEDCEMADDDRIRKRNDWD
jgi:hypothetical protein